MSIETDIQIRRKLAESYQRDLERQKQKYEEERQRRLQQEQRELFEVQKSLQEEQKTLQDRKRQIAQMQYSDYLASLEAKRLKELHDYESKLQSNNVSLPMNSEERLKKYHNYIVDLSNKVDSNTQNYLSFAEKNKETKFFSPLTQKFSIAKNVNKTCDDAIPYSPLINSQSQKCLNERKSSTIGDKRNLTYEEYKKLSKEFGEYNQMMVDMSNKYKNEQKYLRMREEEERKKEMERLKQLKMEEKEFENEKKRQYRMFLEKQMQNRIPAKLQSESYAIDTVQKETNQFKNEQLYQYTKDNSFLNKNKFVEVNPYCAKKYDLGDSTLEFNTILNPSFNYKYNRYLFPRPNSSSLLVGAGNQMMRSNNN